MNFTLQEMVKATGAHLHGNAPSSGMQITSISTDTRTVEPGDCFLALRGENFDAHEFLNVAVEKGASLLVVDRPIDELVVPQLVVHDTLEALGQLAAAWRSRFSVPFAALAGSSGKTTTKEMAAEVVGTAKQLLSTHGNLNNLIGVPKMLFKMTPEHQAVILELGMNLPDENRLLVQMTQPDCLLLTNITHAHVGMFGSHEAHYRAEAEAVAFAPAKTLLILNADDEKSGRAQKEYGGLRPVKTFGVQNPADVIATNVQPLEPYGYRFQLHGWGFSGQEVHLRVFGRHNVSNAVGAAALARFFEIDPDEVAKRLSDFRPRLNRSEVEEIGGWYLIKDYYNAIPGAVQLALESLADFKIPGRRFAVLGDMMELGEFETMYHQQVGQSAAAAGLHQLYTVGERGRIIHDAARTAGAVVEHLGDADTAADRLRRELQPGDLLLLKGSRLMKLERLHELLKSQPV